MDPFTSEGLCPLSQKIISSPRVKPTYNLSGPVEIFRITFPTQERVTEVLEISHPTSVVIKKSERSTKVIRQFRFLVARLSGATRRFTLKPKKSELVYRVLQILFQKLVTRHFLRSTVLRFLDRFRTLRYERTTLHSYRDRTRSISSLS